MRHVRMLGLCLMALLAMAAVTAVVASPALASCSEKCPTEKEKEKNKKRLEKWEEKRVGDPYNINSWGQFKACDYSREVNEYETCVLGITTGGKEGGFFEFGKVKVPLSKSIALQGGFEGYGNGTETTIKVFPAINGYESLDSPELPVTKGIKLFTPRLQEEARWSTSLRESWEEAVKNKETAVNVKIEMAGNECFETYGCLSTYDLLTREGTGFRLALKVKITAPWLEKLASEPCYIGNDEHPIHINLTSAGSGTPGHLEFNSEFDKIGLFGSRLVDTGWHIEPGAYPSGCGGPYEAELQAALMKALELPNENRTGLVVLKGDLWTAEAYSVAESGVESGEL